MNREKKESLLRRSKTLIVVGSIVSIAFAALGTLFTGVIQVSGYHLAPPAGTNPGIVGSMLLFGVAVLGLLVVVAGLIGVGTIRVDRSHG